jgi:PTH1 family peptidyl-tRNA hydrolase
VVFGLGNPGQKYQQTRHNIGFMFLDYIVQKFKIPFRPGRGDYYFSEISIDQNEFLLIKPMTFMNLSGNAVRQVSGWLGSAFGHWLVCYDDFHLPFGTLRFRSAGSSGGHNGVESVINTCQTQEFDRLRFGIGEPKGEIIDYVLSDFSKEEQQQLNVVFDSAQSGLRDWSCEEFQMVMNRYNRSVLEINQ